MDASPRAPGTDPPRLAGPDGRAGPDGAAGPEALACRCLDVHDLLLRLSGRLPDDLVRQARTWLAQGRVLDVARAVAFAAAWCGTGLVDGELELLADLLTAGSADLRALESLLPLDADPAPLFVALPARADPRLRQRGGVAPGPDPGAVRPADRRARDVVRRLPRTHGLWAAWRVTADGSPWPPPTRMYLVETCSPAAMVPLTATVQRALGTATGVPVTVETFTTTRPLPGLQLRALEAAELLWAPAPVRAGARGGRRCAGSGCRA